MSNTIPTAYDVNETTVGDGLVSVTLTAIDADDGSSAAPTFTLGALPAHGTLWAAPPKAFYSVPAPDWSGTTAFDYSVADSTGDNSALATATISVEAEADAPVVHPNANGQPAALGLTQNVASTMTSEGSPQLVALQDGGFVAVWQQGLFLAQVFARYYDDNGAPAGDAFEVAPSGGPFEIAPAATAMPGGGFAVAWIDLNANGSEPGISASIYAAGSKTATTITVAATAGLAEVNPTVTALDHGFVVTWAIENGGFTTIKAQKYTSAGVA